MSQAHQFEIDDGCNKFFYIFQKLIFVYLYLTDGVEGARILAVFPILAHSHFTYYESILSHLNSAGHEITFFSPFPATKTLQNFTMIDSRLQKTNDRSPCSRNFKNSYWLRWMYDTQEIHEKNCYEVAQLPEMKVMIPVSYFVKNGSTFTKAGLPASLLPVA